MRPKEVHVAELLFGTIHNTITRLSGTAQLDSAVRDVANDPDIRKSRQSVDLEVTRQINIKRFNLKPVARFQLAISPTLPI